MLLYERGLLDLEAPVSAIVPEFIHDAAKDPRRQEVTIRMLLSHSSGLPAYEKLFLKANTRAELLQAAFTTPLAANPATRAEYSDIGFIILGIALERLADESLDRFCQREIFAPLAMTNTTFNPPTELRAKIPPTADEREESRGADTPVRQLPKAITSRKRKPAITPQHLPPKNHPRRSPGRKRQHPRRSSPPRRTLLHCRRPGKIRPRHAQLRQAPSSAPKPFPSSPAANPRPQAHPAPWAGILPLHRRSPENISRPSPSATSATPEPLSGSTPPANSRSLC